MRKEQIPQLSESDRLLITLPLKVQSYINLGQMLEFNKNLVKSAQQAIREKRLKIYESFDPMERQSLILYDTIVGAETMAKWRKDHASRK